MTPVVITGTVTITVSLITGNSTMAREESGTIPVEVTQKRPTKVVSIARRVKPRKVTADLFKAGCEESAGRGKKPLVLAVMLLVAPSKSE